MITGREILLTLAVKYQGRWDDIYDAVKAKEHLDDEYVAKIVHDMEVPYVTLVDDDYPEQLHGTFKPPFVLFYQGDLSLIKDSKKSITIIGSKESSVYSTSSAQKFVEGLQNVSIISSFGDTVNNKVLSTALKKDKPIVAIVESGLCTKEVQSHPLYNDLVVQGLIMSELPPHQSFKEDPYAKMEPIGRLLGTMTSSTLVIECYNKDYVALAVSAALNKNSDVYVLPQPISSKSMNNLFIKEGATITLSPKDLQQDLDNLKK